MFCWQHCRISVKESFAQPFASNKTDLPHKWPTRATTNELSKDRYANEQRICISCLINLLKLFGICGEASPTAQQSISFPTTIRYKLIDLPKRTACKNPTAILPLSLYYRQRHQRSLIAADEKSFGVCLSWIRCVLVCDQKIVKPIAESDPPRNPCILPNHSGKTNQTPWHHIASRSRKHLCRS